MIISGVEMIVIGIDPGKEGGIAVLDDDVVLSVIPMPIGGEGIDIARLVDFMDEYGFPTVFLEDVHAMPKNGSIASFKLGEGKGIIEGVVGTFGFPLHLVRPQEWKAKILSGTDKSKDAAIDYVLRTRPGINLMPTERSRKPSDGMAEAVCIAEYGVLKLKGEL